MELHATCVLDGQSQEPLTHFWFKFNLTPHSVDAILTDDCLARGGSALCKPPREAAGSGEHDATRQTGESQLPSGFKHRL